MEGLSVQNVVKGVVRLFLLWREKSQRPAVLKRPPGERVYLGVAHS